MNSNFVNLSDYCIAEFRSTPLGDTHLDIISSEYYLLKNQYVNARQIFNIDGYAEVTHNSRDFSVVSVGDSKVIYEDITLIPIYSEYDPKISQVEVDPGLSTNLVMDTLRIHIASGFNFTEVENFMVGIKHKLNDLTQIQLASVILNSTTAGTIFSYNPKPLFIANTIYDRYIDIKVPSVPYLDADFDQFKDQSFEWAITDGIGFIKGAPLTAYLAELVSDDYNAPNNVTYSRYKLTNYNEGALPQTNIFDNLGCHIQEAQDGDYIEFFATWNGTFPDSLIATLNERGPDQDWIIVHQLNVYEQVGGNIVPSGNAQIYQEDAFDQILTYRPILKEAGFAVSMSIDYTMRLLNKKTGEQVIKTGSMSLINPNKYGKHLAKIHFPDGPQSLKVYNKIIQKNFEAGTLFAPKSAHTQVTNTSGAAATKTTVRTVTVKVPEYLPIKQANIKVSAKNALHKVGNESDQIIYGQGRLTIPVDPVDNIFKFTVYEVNPLDPKSQSRLNLNTNSTFNLTFGETSDLVFPVETDQTLTSPSRGEIAFRIPKAKAKSILQSSDNKFFISIVSKVDKTETLLYTGTWISSSEYGTVIASTEDALMSLENESSLADLQKKISDLSSQNEALQTKVQELTRTKTNTQAAETPHTVNAAAGIKPITSTTSTSGTSGTSGSVKANPKPIKPKKVPYLDPPWDENPRLKNKEFL